MDARSYSVIETLRGGRSVQIRAQRPADREAIADALRRADPETIYRRFFGPRKGFTEKEVAFFLEIDFVNHVALVAEVEEAGRKAIAGGGRYIVTAPGEAEVAFAVGDAYQGQGIGGLVMRHLVTIARARGIRTFVAEVLAGNAPMLKVFKKSGLPLATRVETGIVHATLELS
jgi:RimJ/RimL family protein N-acetyltransferase